MTDGEASPPASSSSRSVGLHTKHGSDGKELGGDNDDDDNEGNVVLVPVLLVEEEQEK